MSSFVIRPATCADAHAIYSLIREHADRLVVRSLSNVIEHIDRFLVAASDEGELIATSAYEFLPEIGDPLRTTAELQSVCVTAACRGRGIGHRLVEEQIARLKPMGIAQVCVLTYETVFFSHLGFTEVDKRTLMHKLYRGCLNCSKHDSPFTCPEHAMVRSLLGN